MNRSAEDYIKTIYHLKQNINSLHSADVARKLGYSRASVSLAMSNLKKDNIIVMNDKGEISFTEKGQEIARGICDRDVILCAFLQQVAGVDEAIAKEDAESIGCYISAPTYEGIRKYVSSQKTPVNDSLK
ncbi:MAG: metal-dependent transcriptional regulator [Lachnospiraceae bacterium]|nr:metal-dependent transcriptional regulator [Lachnospiraceae bacterium]